MSVYYSISDDLFRKFPGFCRGVVIATGIQNESPVAELTDRLRAAEIALSSRLKPEEIPTHPQIASWREAYRSLGVKPSEFRPSVEGLARRVVKGDPLPSINPIVDIGNLVSVRHLVPIGAHAIDVLTQDIELRFARGEEVFEPFGSDAVEHPLPSEIIFVEGNTVLTRRWTWRQAKHTLVLPGTKAVEINVDGLPPVTIQEVDQICMEISALVQEFCGGSLHYEILSIENPKILLQ